MVQASMTTNEALQRDAVALDSLVAQFTTQSHSASARAATSDQSRPKPRSMPAPKQVRLAG
jgi:hypothetical protein